MASSAAPLHLLSDLCTPGADIIALFVAAALSTGQKQ